MKQNGHQSNHLKEITKLEIQFSQKTRYLSMVRLKYNLFTLKWCLAKVKTISSSVLPT